MNGNGRSGFPGGGGGRIRTPQPTSVSSPAEARRAFERTELERALRHRLRHLLERAHDFRSARDLRIKAEQRVRRLEAANPDLAQVGYTRLLGYVFVGFWGVAAALLLEYFLGAPSAEYVASFAFGWESPMAGRAKIAVPLAIVMLELLVASQIQLARMDLRTDALASPQRARVWEVFGFSLALTMPLLTLAQMRASSGEDGHITGFVMLLAGVLMIGIVAHLAVVFGGDSAHRARAYILYWSRRHRLARSCELASRRDQRARDSVRDAFRLYDETYYQYEETYGLVPRGACMAAAELRLVTEAVEQDLPPDFEPDPGGNPRGGGASIEDPPDPDVDEPTTPGPWATYGNGNVEVEDHVSDVDDDGEMEYLRSLVSQHTRDADSELRPTQSLGGQRVTEETERDQ